MSHNDGYPIIHGRATNGKIKAIQTDENGKIEISASDMEINTDGLETLATATNTKLDSLISANHTDLDHLSGNLDTINTTLTAGGVVDISTLATHAKQDTLNTTLGSLSTHAKQDTINTTLGTLNTTLGSLATESTLQIISEFNIDTTDTTITTCALPAGASTSAKQDTLNTTLGTLSTHAKQDTINTTLGTLSTHAKQDTINTTLTNGTQQAKIMGIGDDGTNKQVKTDNSGNVSAFLVSDVVMKPSNITNGDHGSFNASSVASMVRGRTNINDHTTGVFLLCDSAGALSVNSKSTLVKTTGEFLATSTAIGDDTYSSALDCSNFREVRIFGKNAAGLGPASIPLMGSQTDGGTYYKIGDLSRDSVEIGGVSELHYSGKVEMPPNFIKIYNNSGAGVTVEFDYVGFSV